VKLGVIGCGHLGSIHARVWSEITGAELVGVFDVDPVQSNAVAGKLGCQPFRSGEELAAACEAVSICVPTSLHQEVAMMAMARDCHVLVEKPIASTIAEASEMVEMARKRDLKIMVGHVERFNPAMIAAAPYLKNPGFIESHRLAPFAHRGADVAVVLDLMIHDIDLLSMVIGDEIESIDASGVSVLTPATDIANARLRYKNGCVANITASRVSMERMRKIRFFQPDAYISVDLLGGKVEVIRKSEDFDQQLVSATTGPGGLADLRLETLVDRVPVEVIKAEPLRLELEAFLAAVMNDQVEAVSGEEGLRDLKVAMQIMEILKSGS
jgi:predicted dehydrogenase